MNNKRYFLFAILLALVTGCAQYDGLVDLFPSGTVLVSNLSLPIGMSVDSKSQIWVSESGTGEDDARISLVTSTGQRYTVFTGFASAKENGDVEGIGHVLYKNGTLYILEGGTGKLYRADVSNFKPGDPTRTAASLPSEDIGAFVEAQNLSDPVDSDAYDLTFGPDGNLYIADAAANAIIKRDKDSGALSVFARIPNITPQTQAVPTGIVFDGSKFLISTLTGFPFATGSAKIFQVSLTGTVSEYRSGFTTLTNLALSTNNVPVVVEYGQFSLTSSTPGYQPRTGRVANESGTTLLGGLDLPIDIERVGANTYYVLNRGTGTIQTLKY